MDAVLDLKALSKRAVRFKTVEELRALPILYVLERAGVAYEQRDDGVFVAVSPFRHDVNPSFDVFGAKLERWGDWAEGSGGDVLDLLQRLAPALAFLGVKDWATRLLRECGESGWSGPREGDHRKVFDLEQARSYVNGVLEGGGALEPLTDFLRGRDDQLAKIPAAWLIDQFKIGWDGERLVIPYIDVAGKLRWYKTRRPDGQVRAASGGGYDTIFYGSHIDPDPASTVVLCEGESDVWSGTYAAGQRGYAFLGLPTGAGTDPARLIPHLTGRRVLLAFDGDLAGHTATKTWMKALWSNAGPGIYINDLCLPPDKDLSQVGAGWIKAALDRQPPHW